MSPRYVGLLALVGLLAGCGPNLRYASSEPATLRYELMTAEHPDSVARWYQCFALEDAEYRQLCLSRTPGVRVSQGPGASCGAGAAFSLCRAFPIDAPEEYEGSTVDDDNAGAAIVDAFGQILMGILSAALDSEDDDDDDAERDRARDRDDDHEAERRSTRSERRDIGEPRRARQRESRSLKRR